MRLQRANRRASVALRVLAAAISDYSIALFAFCRQIVSRFLLTVRNTLSVLGNLGIWPAIRDWVAEAAQQVWGWLGALMADIGRTLIRYRNVILAVFVGLAVLCAAFIVLSVIIAANFLLSDEGIRAAIVWIFVAAIAAGPWVFVAVIGWKWLLAGLRLGRQSLKSVSRAAIQTAQSASRHVLDSLSGIASFGLAAVERLRRTVAELRHKNQPEPLVVDVRFSLVEEKAEFVETLLVQEASTQRTSLRDRLEVAVARSESRISSFRVEYEETFAAAQSSSSRLVEFTLFGAFQVGACVLSVTFFGLFSLISISGFSYTGLGNGSVVEIPSSTAHDDSAEVVERAVTSRDDRPKLELIPVQSSAATIEETPARTSNVPASGAFLLIDAAAYWRSDSAYELLDARHNPVDLESLVFAQHKACQASQIAVFGLASPQGAPLWNFDRAKRRAAILAEYVSDQTEECPTPPSIIQSTWGEGITTARKRDGRRVLVLGFDEATPIRDRDDLVRAMLFALPPIIGDPMSINREAIEQHCMFRSPLTESGTLFQNCP